MSKLTMTAAVITGAVLGTAGLAACGSSTSTGASGSATQAADHSPLHIMQILPPGNFGLGLLNQGTQAAVDDINAHGGIGGHPVKLDICYDGAPESDPNSTAQCAKQAVSSHEVALVGTFTAFSQDLYPVIQPASIPNISAVMIDPADYTSPLAFALAPNGDSVLTGVGIALGQAGCKKAAFLTPDAGASAAFVGAFAAGAKWAGASVAPAVTVPATQADFAPTIAQFVSEGVDCIGYNMGGQSAAAFLAAIKSSGHSFRLAATTAQLSSAQIAQFGHQLNGTLLVGPFYPRAFDTAGQRNALTDMKKYQGVTAPVDLQIAAWAAVMTFAEAARNVVAADQSVTAMAVTKALDSLRNGGADIEAPLDYAKPGPSALPRIRGFDEFVERISDGARVPVSRTPISTLAAEQKYHQF